MSAAPIEVRVWTVDLDGPGVSIDEGPASPALREVTSVLDEVEQAGAARRAPLPSRRYVAAHVAMRTILGQALGTPPGAIRFDRTCEHCGDPDHGRPRVAGALEVACSLSHSAGLALVAVAARAGGARIGIDVELIRPRRHLDRLAARVLGPDGYRRWCALPEPARLRAFLVGWTEHEAVAKAHGTGIFKAASGASDAGRARRAGEGARDRAGWHVTAVDAGPAAVASLAADAVTAVEGPIPFGVGRGAT